MYRSPLDLCEIYFMLSEKSGGIFMFFLFLLTALSFGSRGEPVAIVADKQVYKEDIPRGMSLEQHLQNIVFFELAEEKGYVDSVKARLDENFDKEMVGRTLRKFTGLASKPTLYECALFYKNSKKRLEVQLIQTKSFSDALEAYLEVLKGEDFGSVSEKYSSNPKLRKSKGLLEHPLSWSFLFPSTFSLLFGMEEGEISVPLKYGGNWNIFKIVDVKIKEGNYRVRGKMMKEILDPALTRQISREKRTIYMSRLQKFIPWIANVEYDSDGLSLFGKRITDSRENSIIPFKREDMGVVLARGSIGEYKIQDFVKDASGAGDLSMFSSRDQALSFIRGNMLDRTVVAISRRLGANRESSLSEAYGRSVRNAVLDFFKRKEIMPVVKETEDDLKRFYENNKDKYEVEERRRISLIEVNEEQEAQEIRERLLKRESFETLASKSIRKPKRKGGDIGYAEKDQKGAIGKEAFLLKKGELSEVFKTEKGWGIIKVTDIKESSMPDYSDVKAAVRVDYRDARAKEIANRIFNNNKEKFGLKVLN